MTYKDSIARYRTILERESFYRKLPLKKMGDKEIMLDLSNIQKQLQELYLLYITSTDVNFIAGTSQYLVNRVYRIKEINIPEQYPALIGISKEQMDSVEKADGTPTKYAKYGADSGMYIEINAIPTNSYHITDYPNAKFRMFYYPKLDLFDSFAGTTTNKTFPDTGTNLWNEVTQQGVWLLPNEWHSLIIDGAIADIFPDRKESFYNLCNEMYKRKDSIIDLSLTRMIGISDGGNE